MATLVEPSVLAVDTAVLAVDGVDGEVQTSTAVLTSVPAAAELVVVGGSDWEAEGAPEDAAVELSEDASDAVPASLAQAFIMHSNVNRDGTWRQRTTFRRVCVSRT